jgi:hypothetical protein
MFNTTTKAGMAGSPVSHAFIQYGDQGQINNRQQNRKKKR